MDRAVRGYAICATPRSGSSYLCQILGSTGALGRPKEYFNVAARRKDLAQDFPEDPGSLIDWIVTRSVTPNGIYGLKLFPDHIDRLAGKPWADRLPALRFVHFSRDDLLGQAISLLRAEQTDRWRSKELARREPRYDAGQILHYTKRIAKAEARWRIFFARNGLVPLRFSYETLSQAPQAIVDQIAALVETTQPAAIDWKKVDVAVQRDAESEDWRARFLRETANVNGLDALDSGMAARIGRAGNALRNRLS